MKLHTTRFGPVDIEAEDILYFASGLIGIEDCQHWVLLSDADNDSVAWLQSVARADVAVPVISPRRFVPGYQLRVRRCELEPLQLGGDDATHVLSVVGLHGDSLSTNLKAPLVINLRRRLGRQVVANGGAPLAYQLGLASQLRKSA